MLQYQTVSPALLKVLKKWVSFDQLSDFELVGGTALALYLGHRISVDIDLFTSKPLNEELAALIFTEPNIQIITNGKYHLSIIDEGIKVDFTSWNLDFSQAKLFDGIPIASLLDIFAMKLDAITSRQTKKDFIDIDQLILRVGLQEGFKHYNKLYPYSKNSAILLDAFGNIDLADDSELPKMLIPITWEATKKRLQIEARNFFNDWKM